MTKILLADLISKAEQELLRLRYSDSAMSYYRRHFNKIADFFESRQKVYYDESIAMNWLDEEYDFSNKAKRKVLTQHEIHRLRCVKTLTSVFKGEEIPLQYTRKIPEFIDESFMGILNRLSEFSESYGYAKSTQYTLRTTATSLFRFMAGEGLSPCNITPHVISEYIRSCEGYTKRTMETRMSSLRTITRFLYDEEIAMINCAPLLPKVSAPRFTTLPSVWNIDDVAKLLATIDRSSPIGKRDYAIILLAFRLGLRGCDIKRLTKENFDFKGKKELRFVQSKTSSPVVLPLLPDVGWAVLEYLKNGRPPSDSPCIFLKHVAPFNPFTDNNHMHSIIIKYARQAGIKLSCDKKHGIHSLRHTLATSLLEQKTDLKDISNLLGHEKIDTTNIYLKKGISFLRECALDAEFEEVPNA